MAQLNMAVKVRPIAWRVQAGKEQRKRQRI